MKRDRGIRWLWAMILAGGGVLAGAVAPALGIDGDKAETGIHPVAAPVVRPPMRSPEVRLGSVQAIKLDAPTPVSKPEAMQIKRLIADLAKIDRPDFGLSPTLSGQAFAPIPGSQQVYTLLLTDHQIKPAEAVRKLVEIGPRALPFLLKSLSDRTPTKLILKHDNVIGIMEFQAEMWGNPLNPDEQDALALVGKTAPPPSLQAGLKSYTVTIGDVCFVIIGQIVGRPYLAVRYQPTACIYINSPTHDAMMARQLRAIWASENPSQHLLDSLLFDYATEGIFNGSSLDGWDIGSELQIKAAMRLLYYFPRQSVPMIAERLCRLKVHRVGPGSGFLHTDAESAAFEKREVANGVRTDEFIKAVSWCRQPAIHAELLSIFRRTTDPDLLLASMPAIIQTDAALVRTRLAAFVRELPATEDGPIGDGYNLLVALGRHVGEGAKPIFRQYLRHASVQRCWTMCQVLRETCGRWSIELLAPLLTDKRPSAGDTYEVIPGRSEPSLPIRICDEAAETIHMQYPNLRFVMAGKHNKLDRQIEAMRRQISRGRR